MPRIRSLTATDIPAAQRLRAQAGWNQIDADWHRLLVWSPDGCWAAEQDGQVVGTTAVVIYGRRIAWIGMVLVDEAHRRRGIGWTLLSHAIEHLDRLGVQTIGLDSTPEGQPLYARLGFADLFELARWRGPIPPSAQGADQAESPNVAPAGSADVPSASSRGVHPRASRSGVGLWLHESGRNVRAPSRVRPLLTADIPAVAAYDAQLFGTDRSHILGAQHAGHPGRCFLTERDGQIAGYVLSRPGARAWHLGPLTADDPQTAEQLARAALVPETTAIAPAGAAPETLPGDMVMDVALPNADAVALARRMGLSQVRRFIRMTRGAPAPAVDASRLYTSAGPELG